MTRELPLEKRCPKCTVVKPSADFNRNAGSYDGLQPYCRECAAEGNRARARDVHRRRVAGELPTFTVAVKRCSRCGETKPAADMGIRRSSPDGLSSWCNWCHRDAQMLRKYGVGAAAYDAMMADQGGQCAICKKSIALVVDHCHATGAVRGLLCGRCNSAIGMFNEDVGSLANAITYIERSIN